MIVPVVLLVGVLFASLAWAPAWSKLLAYLPAGGDPSPVGVPIPLATADPTRRLSATQPWNRHRKPLDRRSMQVRHRRRKIRAEKGISRIWSILRRMSYVVLAAEGSL